jgi:hypothetical protein
MTDESHGMDPIEEPAAQPEETRPVEAHDEASVLAGAGDFTSGEGLVAFAGIVLLLLWLIFDVLLDDYGLGDITVLIAFVVVIIPRLNPDSVARVMPVAVVMKTLGYVLAILGAITFIGHMEDGFFEGFSSIIAALISYAGFVMAFIGARQIKT